MITVLAANTENRPQPMRLEVEGIGGRGEAKVIFENRTLRFSRGMIADMIDAYGTAPIRSRSALARRTSPSIPTTCSSTPASRRPERGYPGVVLRRHRPRAGRHLLRRLTRRPSRPALRPAGSPPGGPAASPSPSTRLRSPRARPIGYRCGRRPPCRASRHDRARAALEMEGVANGALPLTAGLAAVHRRGFRQWGTEPAASADERGLVERERRGSIWCNWWSSRPRGRRLPLRPRQPSGEAGFGELLAGLGRFPVPALGRPPVSPSFSKAKPSRNRSTSPRESCMPSAWITALHARTPRPRGGEGGEQLRQLHLRVELRGRLLRLLRALQEEQKAGQQGHRPLPVRAPVPAPCDRPPRPPGSRRPPHGSTRARTRRPGRSRPAPAPAGTPSPLPPAAPAWPASRRAACALPPRSGRACSPRETPAPPPAIGGDLVEHASQGHLAVGLPGRGLAPRGSHSRAPARKSWRISHDSASP